MEAITDEGMLWHDGKDRNKPAALIEWTDELRKTVDEVLALRRFKGSGTLYLSATCAASATPRAAGRSLHNLMTRCEAAARERHEPFVRFSLQDCRPMGVSDKLENGDNDVQNATLHTTAR